MDKTVRSYATLAAMKDDQYRYWQSRPPHECLEAVAELTLSLYAMKEGKAHVPRFQRVVEILQREPR